MLAYDYPLLDVFVTIGFFILFAIWLYLLVRVISDLFRDREQSGWGIAMWLLIIFVFPYLGVISYIAVHGQKMSLRSMERDRRMAALAQY